MKIHFILPGGGVKGCFQAGFMYHLFKYFPNDFELYQLDGCSVGALNGLAICGGKIDHLKTIWENIHSMNDIFSYQSNIPIWNSLKTIYKTFYYNGIYKNNLKHTIRQYEILEKNNLDKFNCVVTNIETGICEYINGLNPKIKDYVIASSNPWIVASPIAIDNYLYTDGALLQTYPIKYINDSTADLTVIVGYDETHFSKCKEHETNNIIYYLARLIDICRNNNRNIKKTKQWLENNEDLILINSPMKIDTLCFEKEVIQEGFNLGMQAAAKFVLTYLK